MDDDIVDKLPDVIEMFGPFNERVFAPTENTPFVNVSVPLRVTLLFSVTPFVLLTVRLFKAATLLGTFTLVELPPYETFDEDVVDKLPDVTEVFGPFNESVLEPIESAPLVSVSVPLIVSFANIETPFTLFIVKLLNVVTPLIVCALVPLNVDVFVPEVYVPLFVHVP